MTLFVKPLHLRRCSLRVKDLECINDGSVEVRGRGRHQPLKLSNVVVHRTPATTLPYPHKKTPNYYGAE